MNKLPPMFATVRHAARWVAIAVASVVAMPAAAQSPELTTASDVAPDLGAQLRQQVFAMDRAYRSVHDYTATFYKQERVNGELLPVETIEIDPDGDDGPLPFDVYTHVRWDDLADLSPGGQYVLTYLAGIPIRENTLFAEDATPADSHEIPRILRISRPGSVHDLQLLGAAQTFLRVHRPDQPRRRNIGRHRTIHATLARRSEHPPRRTQPLRRLLPPGPNRIQPPRQPRRPSHQTPPPAHPSTTSRWSRPLNGDPIGRPIHRSRSHARGVRRTASMRDRKTPR